ncbi:hypothetical protein AB0L13_46740 [Saccharopolyspora shandongensis]|uniref:hypothetical protein n=1 Tax=Saccharopolyspora shandongensis TaxID=418495 RepID=UPI0034206977
MTFGVNLFAPNPVPVDPEAFRRYARAVAPEARTYGIDALAVGIVEDDDRIRSTCCCPTRYRPSASPSPSRKQP